METEGTDQVKIKEEVNDQDEMESDNFVVEEEMVFVDMKLKQETEDPEADSVKKSSSEPFTVIAPGEIPSNEDVSDPNNCNDSNEKNVGNSSSENEDILRCTLSEGRPTRTINAPKQYSPSAYRPGPASRRKHKDDSECEPSTTSAKKRSMAVSGSSNRTGHFETATSSKQIHEVDNDIDSDNGDDQDDVDDDDEELEEDDLEDPENSSYPSLDDSNAGEHYRPRTRTIPPYKDTNSTHSDERIFCHDCCREWEGDCPRHGPLIIVEDTPVPADINDALRAIKTAPPELTVSKSKIAKAGCGVHAAQAIPGRVRFGPYQGKIVPPMLATSYAWLIRKNGKPDHCVDATEAGCSNWMRYVNCSRTDEERNLEAFQFKGKLYYKTLRPVAEGEELLVSYGEAYERHLCELEKNQTWEGAFGTPDCSQEADILSNDALASDCDAQYFCTDCRVQLPSEDLLNLHQRSHKVGDLFVCILCNKRFSEKCYLQRHVRIHIEQKKHQCNECDKRFRRKEDLVCHVRSHTGEKPYVCADCNKGFPGKEHLKRHSRTHTGEKPFVCGICEKRFSDRGSLATHLRTHSGEKPYHCPECYKLFARKQDMRRHLQTHSNVKPYGCTQCEKRFFKKNTLACHLKKHSGLRPHVCKHCDKAFGRSEHLKRHIMCTHSDDKPFVCADCNKRFALIDHLKRHLVVHTEVKPHMCPYCKRRYSQLQYLKKHSLTHCTGATNRLEESCEVIVLSDDEEM